ncbi:hypothetical protein IC582_011952 [Cucumis melo]|uniref:Arabinogalactan protein 22 n=2 Tax=Cucumis melo TaxID=3656 RepID=A0A5A7V7C0_CUCMM|nr:putative Arabinogalactan protein 22 [Cucumis melo var. makuwa]TYK10713.1 putative Arabinogalactan protein 22 [Cucumis melo var. makuwa]
MSSLKLTAVPFVGFLFLIILQLAHGHSHDISPAEGPSNDGAAIDQGIAYVLLLLALAITYIIH